MDDALHAGAARRTINPPLGTGKIGGRGLFGSPIQAIESDLTATVLVLGDGDTKVALIATDLCVLSMEEAGRLRGAVAAALGVPVSHVLLNLSHNHSSPALGGLHGDDRYTRGSVVPSALRGRSPALARRGSGRGRRGPAAGADRLRLGRERDRRVPSRAPRRPRRARRGARPSDRQLRRGDPRRRPRRQPDRDRLPLLGPPRHGREPVAGRVLRLPRPGARGARAQPRRPRPVPPGVRRQRQPPRRHRLRGRLPRHEEPRRPRARRRGPPGRRPHPHEHPARRTAAARQRPQHPLHPLGAGRRSPHLHAPRRRRDHRPPRLRRAAHARASARDPRPLGADAGGADRRRRPRLGDPVRAEVRALGAKARRGRRITGTRRTSSTCRPSASTTSSSAG